MKLLSLFAFVLFVNCSFINPCGDDKDQFLYNFHKFTKDIKEKELTYNDKEWENLDAQFRKFTKECYPKFKEEFTRADREEYYENTMSFYITKYGEGLAKQYAEDGEFLVEEIGSAIEDWMENEGRDIEEKVQEWLDTEGRDIEERMQEWFDTEGRELGNQLERTFRDLEKSIDKEKIEEALQRLGDFLKDIEINVESEDEGRKI